METEIDDTASRRRSRKTGATAPMGFTGGEPPFRSCRYAAPEPCPGIIACNTSEPAGSSLFRPPGKVRACGARSETSPTEWKPVPEQRDAADDPPGPARLALSLRRVACQAGRFPSNLFVAVTEWKCNLDCHYCWALTIGSTA